MVFALDIAAVGVVCFGVLFFIARANVRAMKLARSPRQHPGPPHSNVRKVRRDKPAG